jgi:hypothetical protein
VLVEPAAEQESQEPDVKLTVIEPAPKPTPVGVGASDGGHEDEPTAADPDPPAGDPPSHSE